MNAVLSETLWSSTITPKGLRELFIQWVVPAIKFDWFTYIPAAMFIPLASSPLHSPSRKWVIWGPGGEGWFRRYSGNRQPTVHSLPIKAEKIACRPCDTSRCKKCTEDPCRCSVERSGLLVVLAKSKSLLYFAFFKFGVYFFLEIAQPWTLCLADGASLASSSFLYAQAKCQRLR